MILSGALLLVPAILTEALSPEQLKNASYHGIYDEPVQLDEGKYEGEPFEEDGVSRPTVTFLEGLSAFGDLNGDGLEDAALVLLEDSGGSGSFSYLAAVLNCHEEPFNQATLLLGDRVGIKSLAIKDGKVLVDVVEQNEIIRKSYQFSFAESGSEKLGSLSFGELEGVEWVLTGMGPERELVEDVEITAGFAEGKISGSSGCNHYSATAAEKKERALEIGQAMGTRKACPEEILKQEHEFLAALGTVSQFGFSAGQLALKHENGTLFFRARQLEKEEMSTTSLKDLEGTKWQLIELEPEREIVSETEITIEFSAGKISGSNGCNNYSAKISEDELGTLSIGMALGTMKACPKAVMAQEHDFMAKLVDVTQARLSEDRLELIHENGSLIFIPQSADSE